MLRKAYTAMVWVGVPMFLLGCEVQAPRSVSWAWAVWAAVALLSLAGDQQEARKAQRRAVRALDREVSRYQREDQQDPYAEAWDGYQHRRYS